MFNGYGGGCVGGDVLFVGLEIFVVYGGYMGFVVGCLCIYGMRIVLCVFFDGGRCMLIGVVFLEYGIDCAVFDFVVVGLDGGFVVLMLVF